MKNHPFNIGFTRIKKYSFIISLFFALIFIIPNFINRVKLGINFKGGTLLIYSYNGEINKEEIQNKLEAETNKKLYLQQVSNIKDRNNEIIITLPSSLKINEARNFDKILKNNFKANNFEIIEINSVQSTVGYKFLASCLIAAALIIVFIMIFIAIKFRNIGGFKRGISVIIVLFYNAIIAVGVFIFLKNLLTVQLH